MATLFGMALGGWMSGEVFDLTGSYRAAFINPNSKLLGPKFKFAKHGQCGAEVSELLPHLSKIVDDIAIVKSMHTDAFNHAPGQILMNTGSQQFGAFLRGIRERRLRALRGELELRSLPHALVVVGEEGFEFRIGARCHSFGEEFLYLARLMQIVEGPDMDNAGAGMT